MSVEKSHAKRPPREGATKTIVPAAATLWMLPSGRASTRAPLHVEGCSLDQSHTTKCKPSGPATMMPSVALNVAAEAALPGTIGTAAPKELTASQWPPDHRNSSSEASANATELPPNVPLNADCKLSNGNDGHAGVIGVDANVKREATYLQKCKQGCGPLHK
jgi:hypothetical protein